MELEELEETTENFGDTFDHSFRNTIDNFRVFRDEFMMVGEVLRMSFEAAFAPLEEGETRLGNFREAFVNQLKMMAAQLLATAAAAAILATILTIAISLRYHLNDFYSFQHAHPITIYLSQAVFQISQCLPKCCQSSRRH